MNRRVSLTWLTVAATLVAGIGCLGGQPADDGASGDRAVLNVSVDTDQRVVAPSSVIEFRLEGTRRVVAKSATVSFAGVHSAQGKFVHTYQADIQRSGDVGDLTVKLPVAQTLWRDAGRDGDSSFEGAIDIELSDTIGPVARGEVAGAHLDFVGEPQPDVQPFRIGETYPDQLIDVDGSGFLRPAEGTTVAVVDSGMVTYRAGSSRDIGGDEIKLRWTGSRTRAQFPVDPAVFGVEVATFSARIHLENRLDGGSISGRSDSLELDGHIQQAYLARLSPEAGSRGQRITMVGRGLVDINEDAGYGMVLRYEGVLTPDDPDLPVVDYRSDPLRRAPDRVVDEQHLLQSVWYAIEDDRTLTGLGKTPGVFEGTITPELFDRFGHQRGIGWNGRFRVLPTRQVVYLKYLPAFYKGLQKYGLRNVERAIRDRILAVVRRDYDGINVDFRETEPDDFIDYAVVEIGGPDPSGRQAFGYDNTFNGVAKDTGNLFLADYLGGLNAQSGQEFNNPYGGIFIESFSFFSPTLNPDNQHASGTFDNILSPFMPALDGEAIKGTEWPDGPRRDQISRAIHMMGSLVGNTVTHELGHSLGLAYVPADDTEPTNRFHNRVSGPFIMDAGAERPFTERAEIRPYQPAHFNERNAAYLRRYLPGAD